MNNQAENFHYGLYFKKRATPLLKDFIDIKIKAWAFSLCKDFLGKISKPLRNYFAFVITLLRDLVCAQKRKTNLWSHNLTISEKKTSKYKRRNFLT